MVHTPEFLAISGWSFNEKAMHRVSEIAADGVFTAFDPLKMPPLDDSIWQTSSTQKIGLGWSFGAMLLLKAVADNRLSPNVLILASATPRFLRAPNFPPGCSPAFLRTLTSGLKRDPNAALAAFRGSVSTASFHQEEHSSATLGHLLQGLEELASIDVRASLGKIDVPVLLFHGCKDSVIHVNCAIWLQHRLRQAALVQIEEAGHDLLLTHRALVIDNIRKFLHKTNAGYR